MVHRRLLLCAGLAAGLIAAVPSHGGATTPQGAVQHIQRLGSEALAVMRRQDISLAQREAAFRRIISEGFDVVLIARFVLGRYWRAASHDERVDFVELFHEYMLRSFAQRLGGYQGEDFTVTGAQPAGKHDIMVRTRIDRPSGPAVEAAWRVREIEGRHRILDVMVQGVSLAITQRDEFASVIQRSGIQGLLQTLRAKTQRLSVSGS